MPTPHDKLFRAVFSRPANAEGLLRSSLPPSLVRAIDWRQLVRQRRSFVDTASREHHADLLFSAPIGKREVLLYLLLEHKSSADRFTALQVLGYLVAILQDHRKRHKRATHLPLLLPIVVHHDDRALTAPVSLRPLFALDDLPRAVARWLTPLQPDCHFVLDDLALASEADIEARTLSAMAQLSLLFLQHVRHQSPAKALAAIPRWATTVSAVGKTPGGRRRLFTLWSYFLAVTEVHAERLCRAVVEVLGEDAGDSVMSTAEKLIAKGRRQGKAEGKAEGRAKRGAELLLRQLATRFGPPPDAVITRVQTGSSADVDRWAVRILHAQTLDDVFVGG